jgi:hypothetical protein
VSPGRGTPRPEAFCEAEAFLPFRVGEEAVFGSLFTIPGCASPPLQIHVVTIGDPDELHVLEHLEIDAPIP